MSSSIIIFRLSIKLWGVVCLNALESLAHRCQGTIQSHLCICRSNIVQASPNKAHKTISTLVDQFYKNLGVISKDRKGDFNLRLLAVCPFDKVGEISSLGLVCRSITSKLSDKHILFSISIPQSLDVGLCGVHVAAVLVVVDSPDIMEAVGAGSEILIQPFNLIHISTAIFRRSSAVGIGWVHWRWGEQLNYSNTPFFVDDVYQMKLVSDLLCIIQAFTSQLVEKNLLVSV